MIPEPLEPWSTVDVSDWVMEIEEPRGRRVKGWYKRPGDERLWLRKTPRSSRPFEVVTEIIGLRLAKAVGIAAPSAHACTWQRGEDVAKGIVVRSFLVGPEESLIPGVEVLEGLHSDYHRTAHEAHSLARVRRAVAAQEGPTQGEHLRPLMEILLLDAWIGNGDRHQENWGFVRDHQALRIAPTYDVAACLGSELKADHHLLKNDKRTRDRVLDYIRKCPSGFGDGESRLVRQAKVVEELSGWPEFQGVWQRLRPVFEAALPWVSTFIASIPRGWFPEERAILATTLLELRLDWLKENARAHR